MEDQQTKLKIAKRYRYAENYKMSTRTAPDGTVTEIAEYIGDYLKALHTEEQYGNIRILSAATGVISLCAVLALLCVRSFSVYYAGMYVFVPITASLIPVLYLFLGIRKFPVEDRKLQEDTYRFAHVRVQRSSMGICVMLFTAALLTVIFFLTSGNALKAADVLFFVLLLVPAVMNLVLFRKAGSLHYENSNL